MIASDDLNIRYWKQSGKKRVQSYALLMIQGSVNRKMVHTISSVFKNHLCTKVTGDIVHHR